MKGLNLCNSVEQSEASVLPSKICDCKGLHAVSFTKLLSLSLLQPGQKISCFAGLYHVAYFVALKHTFYEHAVFQI